MNSNQWVDHKPENRSGRVGTPERQYGRPEQGRITSAPSGHENSPRGKNSADHSGRYAGGPQAGKVNRREQNSQPAFKAKSVRRDGKPAPHDGTKVFAKPVQMNRTPRFMALMVLEDVMNKDAYASMALDERFADSGMSQADKHLATSITYGTLENLIRLDWILDQFLDNRKELPQQIQNVLRMSVCQIFFFDRLPENAIVDEAVKIVRFLKFEPFTGLTNGVLRNVLRNRNTLRYPDGNNEGKKAEYLSVMFSAPVWLAERLIREYGEETAEKILSNRKEKHYVTVRPNLDRFSSDESFEREVLSKKVWTWEKGILPHAYRIFGISDLAGDSDYLAGNFSVQGESSMACASAAGVKAGMKILDCCAAPGGKTAYMAELLHGTGRIYAWDVHEHRVDLIRAMTRRLKLDNVRPAARDASLLKEDLVGTLDLVLLDAPCSNLGVIDDKPDVKMRVTEQSVQELVKTQEKLLEVCSSYVKKGGRIIYSTCSILKEENELQIAAFLERHPEFAIDMNDMFLPNELQIHCTEKGLQIQSYRDGIEGFYIARLRRIK